MSNINIFDLPTLSVDNFYPDSDFVIVQRPGGGTYRILASEALSVSKNVKDRKSGAHDIILEESIEQTGENSETIIFENENLLEKDSSWNINIALTVKGDHSDFYRNATDTTLNYNGNGSGTVFGSIYRNLPSIGDQRFINISKPRNSNLINSRYLVGKTSTLAEKFDFYYDWHYSRYTGRSMTREWRSSYVIYSVILDTEEQNKIKLSFKRSVGTGISAFPAAHVGYTIALTAQI